MVPVKYSTQGTGQEHDNDNDNERAIARDCHISIWTVLWPPWACTISLFVFLGSGWHYHIS